MIDGWLHAPDGRMRAGWRIALFLGLFVLLFVAGQYAASVLPRDPLGIAGGAITTLAALAAGWIVLVHADGRPIGALGFYRGPSVARECLLGLGVGAGFIGATVLLLLVTGTVAWVPDEGTPAGYLGSLLGMLAFFLVAAAAEELLFRGYAFQALVEATGPWVAVLATSGLFAAAHLQNPNIDAIGFANILLAGVMLGVAYLRTRSLWFATAVHAGWNWAMAGVLDFPVSGLTGFDTPLYTAAESGADWWTGGAFGPEAGLAATLVLLAGTVWLLRSPRFREAPELRRLRPLVDARLGEGGP